MTVVSGNIVAFTFAVAIVADATLAATFASENFRRHDSKKVFFPTESIFPAFQKNFFDNMTNVTIAYGITTHSYIMKDDDTFERLFHNVSKIHRLQLRFQFNDADVKPQDTLCSLLNGSLKQKLRISAFKDISTHNEHKRWIYRPYKPASGSDDKKLATIKKRKGVKYVSLPLKHCLARLQEH